MIHKLFFILNISSIFFIIFYFYHIINSIILIFFFFFSSLFKYRITYLMSINFFGSFNQKKGENIEQSICKGKESSVILEEKKPSGMK